MSFVGLYVERRTRKNKFFKPRLHNKIFSNA